jgi:hypothetical protein
MPAVKLDNLTFVHIPKSAGTSIGHWMRDNKGSSSYQEWYTHPTLEEMNSLGTSFTVVRNPWDRIVSYYEFLKNFRVIGHPHISNETAQRYLNHTNGYTTWPNFEIWVKNLESFKMFPNYILKFNIFTPQSHWANGVNIVLRYENLEQEFIKVQDFLNCTNTLPKENSSVHDNYKYLYNSTTKDLVYKWFETDIKQWKYEF